MWGGRIKELGGWVELLPSHLPITEREGVSFLFPQQWHFECLALSSLPTRCALPAVVSLAVL